MIALGVRLSLAGGRRAVWTSLITVSAIALGTTLLLFAACVPSALQHRADRTAWINSGYGGNVSPAAHFGPKPATVVTISADYYQNVQITLVSVSGTGPDAPVPPGVSRVPAVGDVMVSPALQRLLHTAPLLAQRYGRVVGLVGNEGLGSPDDLVAVRGVSARDAALTGVQVSQFPVHDAVRRFSGTVRLLLLVGEVGTVAPIVLLVLLANRLVSVSRGRRLAALRLAGATDAQVTMLTVVEAALLGLAAAIFGLGLAILLRPWASYVSYNGGRWFGGDLVPSAPVQVAVLVAVPVVTAVATWAGCAAALRAPLRAARRGTGRPVRAWRVVPLAAAVAATAVAVRSKAATSALGGHGLLVTGAFIGVLVGVAVAGPWLTRLVGAVLVRAPGAPALLAGRRTIDDSRAAFRASSGMVFAVLVTTLFVAATPAAAESLRSTTITGQAEGSAQADILYSSPSQSTSLVRQLSSVPGVSDATLVYTALVQTGPDPATVWVGDCAAIVAASHLSGVPCGRAPVLVAANLHGVMSGRPRVPVDNLWPATVRSLSAPPDGNQPGVVTLTSSAVAAMPPQTGIDVPTIIASPEALSANIGSFRPTLLVMRYASSAALEQARSIIVRTVAAGTVSTRETTYNGYSSDLRRFYRVLLIAALAVFAVASATLAISVAVGLLERRQPFALLRAAGTSITTLRRTLFLEALAPLTVSVVLAAGIGALVGRWTAAAGSQTGSATWVQLCLPATAGLIVAAGIVGAAVLGVGPATRTDQTHFE